MSRTTTKKAKKATGDVLGYTKEQQTARKRGRPAKAKEKQRTQKPKRTKRDPLEIPVGKDPQDPPTKEKKAKKEPKKIEHPIPDEKGCLQIEVSEQVGVHFSVHPDHAPKLDMLVYLHMNGEKTVPLAVRSVREKKDGSILVQAFVQKGSGQSLVLAKHKGEPAIIQVIK